MTRHPDDGSPLRLAYPFARRKGVLITDEEQEGEAGSVRGASDGAPSCIHRADADLLALLEAQRCSGQRLSFVPLDDSAFETALNAAYSERASVASAAAAADPEAENSDGIPGDLTALADSAAEAEDLLDQQNDAPVVRLINALLLDAVQAGASDVHIEVEATRLSVRFRIDGVLRDRLEPKRRLAPSLVSRIKVMARLDIAEKRLPQDGRVSLRIGGREVDVRVSTIPSHHGERVVLRLLDRGAVALDLGGLGLCEEDRATLERILARPNGMLLVTGPTGSGKTTTLYAALAHLNDRARNIMTVEDPVEYALPGISQTQVQTQTDMTFARGLRAILRQDPDIVMVGEIRDRETAAIAVQASMTGHLILSTLHTNSAVASVTRLLDMGIERYLLAPTLSGLVAQRLVRQLCPDCRSVGQATEAEAALLGGALTLGEQVFRPGQTEGTCPTCAGQGYRGRLALYEVIEITDPIRSLIHQGASEAELTRAARDIGADTGARARARLLSDGLAKIREGLTTVEDVARVVREG